jgi:hypothetical protein
MKKFSTHEIHSAIDKMLDLSITGFDCSGISKINPIKTPAFAEGRARLYDFMHLEQIHTCIDYLDHNNLSEWGSYGAKHDMERWGRAHGGVNYITNGCAIVAAVLAGYTIIREHDSPNCRFSKKPEIKNKTQRSKRASQ